MEIELKEIRDFIAAIPPFDRLSQEKLDELTRHLSIEYVRRGRTVPSDPDAPPRLYILRRGAVAMYSGHNTLMGMLGEGDICTSFCAAQLMPDFSVRTTEDTLFYTIPRCPPWRAKRRRVVPGSREATRDTRRAEGAKGDPKGASERGVQSYGRPVCSRNELAMLWRNAG